MGKLALKYGSFCNVLMMEIWFLDGWYKMGAFNWEPFFLFLTSLSTLIYLEYLDQRKIEPSDKKLFHDFMNSLPYEKSIAFIDSNDMSAGPFDPVHLEDLKNFYRNWDCASHEFIHNGIEKRRRALWGTVESYITAIETYTVPADNGKRMVSPELKEVNPDKWREIINDFHNLAGLIVLTHQDFVRYTKKKLRIF
ncbi:MAG TPA: hypothetical protein VMZ04_03230 [Anaerolineae bacterium]|nr:hypothetical protein [Anaerolineae bacterium]